MSKKKSQAGQVSRSLIIIAAVVLVAVIVVFLLTEFAYQGQKKNTPSPSGSPTPYQPVYETTVGNIDFSVQSAQDLGSTIPAPNAFTQPLTTTDRFIEVTVGATNEGKADTQRSAWDIGPIVDSEGRMFEDINDNAYDFLPKPDHCGEILHPAFTPSPCVKLYEVAKVSKGLKITVTVGKESALLDLNVQ